MSQMLQYKDDIHFCYSEASNVEISHHDRVNTEWAVVQFVVHFIKPILDIWVVNQSQQFGLLQTAHELQFNYMKNTSPLQIWL